MLARSVTDPTPWGRIAVTVGGLDLPTYSYPLGTPGSIAPTPRYARVSSTTTKEN